MRLTSVMKTLSRNFACRIEKVGKISILLILDNDKKNMV